jgi:glycosyltransferase involved in cell wall biosynthesis
MTLSVIIPVFNEENTIISVLQEINRVSLPPETTLEIIVINDGSTDGTAERLKEYHASQIKIFTQRNKGKTAAIWEGLKHATGDWIVIQDADLEYSPLYYPALLQPIIDGKADIVFGSRFLGKIERMALINRLANIFSNLTFNLLHGTHLTDINTCFKIFPRRALEGLTITSQHFTFETEITSKFVNRGFRITEIPIDYTARSLADGKKINWKKAVNMYYGIFRFLGSK